MSSSTISPLNQHCVFSVVEYSHLCESCQLARSCGHTHPRRRHTTLRGTPSFVVVSLTASSVNLLSNGRWTLVDHALDQVELRELSYVSSRREERERKYASPCDPPSSSVFSPSALQAGLAPLLRRTAEPFRIPSGLLLGFAACGGFMVFPFGQMVFLFGLLSRFFFFRLAGPTCLFVGRVVLQSSGFENYVEQRHPNPFHSRREKHICARERLNERGKLATQR